MSFGFGIGDFVALIHLADSVRKKWTDAPIEYATIREKVKTVGSLLRDIDDLCQLDDLSSQNRDRLLKASVNAQQALRQCEKLADRCVVGKASTPSQRRLRRAWDRIRSDPAEVRNARQLLDSCVVELGASLDLAQSFVLSAIHTAVDGLQSDNSQRLKNDIATWLSSVDHGSYQDDHFSRRTASTGHWFLQHPLYRHWRDTSNSKLLCPGAPGAGKTIMTATVISDLREAFAHDKQVAVVYFYCNFARPVLQTPRSVLAGLARQLLQALQQLPQYILQLYEKHQKEGTIATKQELQHLLELLLREYRRVFILVDALDEFGNNTSTLAHFLETIFSFQGLQDIDAALMFTSRPIANIVDRIKCPRLEIRAHHDDIQLYLERRLSELMIDPDDAYDGDADTTTVAEAVVSSIVNATDGMFLLAKLQFDSLLDKMSIDEIQDALSRFSGDQSALDQQYDNALTRIEQQLEGRRALAHKVLAWVTFARRELSVLELREAVAVKEGMTRLSKRSTPQAKYLTAFCAGLVVVDETAGVIRLVHYTAQEYLERVCEQRILPEEFLASACIHRLMIGVEEPQHWYYAAHVEQQLEDHPFLHYAATNFGWHMLPSLPNDQSELLLELLQNEESLKLLGFILTGGSAWSVSGETEHSGLHICSNFDVPELMQLLLDTGADLNCQDVWHDTCLHAAARLGHTRIVRFLLGRATINLNMVNLKGETPLTLAVYHGHTEVVELFLAHDNAGLNTHTILFCAVQMGRADIVRQLLSVCNIDVNWIGPRGETALSETARAGNLEVVRLLLASEDIDVNLAENKGLAPLMAASEAGHSEVVSALLACRDINVN